MFRGLLFWLVEASEMGSACLLGDVAGETDVSGVGQVCEAFVRVFGWVWVVEVGIHRAHVNFSTRTPLAPS
jgi:hypothetical protein